MHFNATDVSLQTFKETGSAGGPMMFKSRLSMFLHGDIGDEMCVFPVRYGDVHRFRKDEILPFLIVVDLTPLSRLCLRCSVSWF